MRRKKWNAYNKKLTETINREIQGIKMYATTCKKERVKLKKFETKRNIITS